MRSLTVVCLVLYISCLSVVLGDGSQELNQRSLFSYGGHAGFRKPFKREHRRPGNYDEYEYDKYDERDYESDNEWDLRNPHGMGHNSYNMGPHHMRRPKSQGTFNSLRSPSHHFEHSSTMPRMPPMFPGSRGHARFMGLTSLEDGDSSEEDEFRGRFAYDWQFPETSYSLPAMTMRGGDAHHDQQHGGSKGARQMEHGGPKGARQMQTENVEDPEDAVADPLGAARSSLSASAAAANSDATSRNENEAAMMSEVASGVNPVSVDDSSSRRNLYGPFPNYNGNNFKHNEYSGNMNRFPPHAWQPPSQQNGMGFQNVVPGFPQTGYESGPMMNAAVRGRIYSYGGYQGWGAPRRRRPHMGQSRRATTDTDRSVRSRKILGKILGSILTK